MANFLNSGAALLARLPAEMAHDLTLALLGRVGPLLSRPLADPPCLKVSALGLDFPNPVGLAAGFDKNARVPDAMAKLGFGFVECGTVTPRPQSGNAKPRLFRLREDQAVINRMGFNNGGMEKAAANLAARGPSSNENKGITGINIGANKDSADRIADYRAAFTRLASLADYVTVNISSPNTPGLRGLQNKEELNRLIGTVLEARGAMSKPVLVKIAPDLDETALDEIAAVALMGGIDGLIVSNTTIARPPLRSRHYRESGGLSGVPLKAPSLKILRGMRQRVGSKLVLIGVGGISSGVDAYAKIRAGATLVQLYTALVYGGPGLVGRIKSELAECLTRDGYDAVAEAVGADA
jgi:dihydroorotate dehydrogenase